MEPENLESYTDDELCQCITLTQQAIDHYTKCLDDPKLTARERQALSLSRQYTMETLEDIQKEQKKREEITKLAEQSVFREGNKIEPVQKDGVTCITSHGKVSDKTSIDTGTS